MLTLLQIAAADKQLRSTRAFLEEQASEREQERDEFNKELSRLREQLRDRDKDWTTKERFATEVSTHVCLYFSLITLLTVVFNHLYTLSYGGIISYQSMLSTVVSTVHLHSNQKYHKILFTCNQKYHKILTCCISCIPG